MLSGKSCLPKPVGGHTMGCTKEQPMPVVAYVRIKGQKSGDISGPVAAKGHEGTIAVHAYNTKIASPRDAASGLPVSQRMHSPISMVKETDKTSPLLWQVLVTNENLTKVTLDFFSVAVPEKKIYTIELTNAAIASIEGTLNNQDPTRAGLPLQELLTFTYQKIEWIWAEGGITAGDDWQARV
jgi:type VI secretion system secreted protein Hcp